MSVFITWQSYKVVFFIVLILDIFWLYLKCRILNVYYSLKIFNNKKDILIYFIIYLIKYCS